MSWTLQHPKLVTHKAGHKIELKAGTWLQPYDISPQFVKGTPAVETVRLIREALEFAKDEMSIHV